jgi:hypothetical protein
MLYQLSYARVEPKSSGEATGNEHAAATDMAGAAHHRLSKETERNRHARAQRGRISFGN